MVVWVLGVTALMVWAGARCRPPGDQRGVPERKRQRHRVAQDAGEPEPLILRTARLEMAEEDIACGGDNPLHGRPDEVYRIPSGELLLVDTKRRPRLKVYPSDRAELSVYREIFRTRGEPVLRWAFVRIEPPDGGSPTYLRTRLFGQSVIRRLAQQVRESRRLGKVA